MNKLIHTGFFNEVFRQLKVAGLVSAGILMIGNVSKLLSLLTSSIPPSVMPGAMSLASSMMAYVYIMGFVLTFIAFGWMNKRATSDFYHSIPVTRTQMYFSTVAAILLWMFIGITAYSLVEVLMYLLTDSPFNYLLYLGVYINMLIGAVEVVGAVSLACAISGTKFVNFVAACVILFVPRFLLTVLSGFILVTPGGDALYPAKMCWLFDPNYNIFGCPYGFITNTFIKGGEYSFANVPAMIYTLVYSAVLVFFGWRLFKKRKSEAAGIPTTNKAFQTIIRIAFGIPLILVLDMLILTENYDLRSLLVPGVLLILFAFVFYCLYELISTKSAKKMAKSMPMFLVCLGIGVLFLVVPKLISKAARSVELRPENIKSYQIVDESDSILGMVDGLISNKDYRSIAEGEIKYNDPEGIKTVSDAFNRWKRTGESGSFPVKINRKIGAPIMIDLDLTQFEFSKIDTIRTTDPEYQRSTLEIPEGKKYFVFSDLSKAQAKELGRIFLEEYNSLSDGDKAFLISDMYNEGDNVRVLGCVGAKNYVNVYELNNKLPKTRAAYLKAMNEANAEKTMKALSDICKQIDEAGSSEGSYPNYWIYIGGAVQTSFDAFEFNYDEENSGMTKKLEEAVRILASGKPDTEADPANTVTVKGYFYDNSDFIRGTMGTTSISLSDADIERLLEIAEEVNSYHEGWFPYRDDF